MTRDREPEFDPSIDIDNLVKEWADQPARFYYWSRRLANARQAMDEAKQALDVQKSELDFDIRRDPETFNLPKVTDAAVAAAIPMQREYKDAYDDFLKAKRYVDLCGAAVAAMDHRKRALEKIVELWIAGYFAEPRAKGDTRELMEEEVKHNTRRRGRGGRPGDEDDGNNE